MVALGRFRNQAESQRAAVIKLPLWYPSLLPKLIISSGLACCSRQVSETCKFRFGRFLEADFRVMKGNHNTGSPSTCGRVHWESSIWMVPEVG